MALTLAAVEMAIEALMAGAQSFSVDGLVYTQANLATLIQLRNDLKAQESRASTRPLFRAAKFGNMGYT